MCFNVKFAKQWPSRISGNSLLVQMLETTCGESRRCLWEHFSRRESVGDMQVLLRRRMAQHRMSRILDKVKAAEKENFDGSIYDEKGKNKARSSL